MKIVNWILRSMICCLVLVANGEENEILRLRLGESIGDSFLRSLTSSGRPMVAVVIPDSLSELDATTELRSLETLRKPLTLEGIGLQTVRASVRFTAIVDGGMLRYSERPKEAGEQRRWIASSAVTWNRGRQAFSVHCAHCHGEDGSETSYPNVKSLSGISKRTSEQKILEGARDFGAVDVYQWGQRERDDLLMYVRGL